MIEKWQGKWSGKSAEKDFLLDRSEIWQLREDKQDAEAVAANPVAQFEHFREEDIDKMQTFGIPLEESLGIWAVRDMYQLIATIREYRLEIENELLQTIIDSPRSSEDGEIALWTLLKEAGYTKTELLAACNHYEMDTNRLEYVYDT
ncbi:MAG TPA: hypothetical protein VKP88_02405 [Candidatus Paceibacterota bacterium]|nr:hypothetical protein [Candidatus Paceibacterota bacterium]